MADDREKDDALFVNLVMIFQGAAMQQLGKVINPLTGKTEKNLEQARFSIDTLAMLRQKTLGNLSGDLERLLDSVLVNLRMNFVEEAAAVSGGAEDAPGRIPDAGPDQAGESSGRTGPAAGAAAGGAGAEATRPAQPGPGAAEEAGNADGAEVPGDSQPRAGARGKRRTRPRSGDK